MQTALLIFHFGLCLFLIGAIMLQSGKGADIGAAFGAGGSQTVFGPRGAATFLNKLTAIVAILFLFTSITLARLAKTGGGKSVFEKVGVEEAEPAQPKVDMGSEETKESTGK